MPFSWKNITLPGQISSSWIHQVETRKFVLSCYLLGPQMFSYSYGVVRSPFNWRIIGHNHTKSAFDQTYPSNNSSRINLFLPIQLISSQRWKLKKRWPWIQQLLNPLPDNQFASFVQFTQHLGIILSSDLDISILTLDKIPEYLSLTSLIICLFLTAFSSLRETG